MPPLDRTSDRSRPSDPDLLREVELVRAKGFADLLSVVPSLLGVLPQESLVVVPFLGRRTVGGFRLPLAAELRPSDVDALAEGAVASLAAVPEADGVLAVVYTDRSFDAEAGIPRPQLGRALVERLERTDLGIVGVACVASDGWGRYTIPSERRTPRPLAGIEDSESGLFSRAVADEPLDVSALAVLPVVEEDDRRVVEAVLATPPGGMLEDPTAVVERWLQGPSVARREGRVLQLLQSPPLRDQLTLQIALGPHRARSSFLRMVRQQAEQEFTGETMDEIIAREAAIGRTDARDVADAELLMGEGPGPDRGRLERATTALARTAALAPPGVRVPVLTVLAWCWWARGVGSLAALHLGEARRLDPAYSMAQLYESLFAARRVPGWVLDGTSRRLLAAAERR
ncbi:DUF4192 family protein [Rathayibacter sp. SD072]|uniref:DUF4192 family protein n=1 Tax=Rathayibacter sp. SD072 TaxID=2781731 RepID=UPI001A96AD2C|nr:DUF4192 family protein [Rathayibacter sp. SD072]MBO0984698.1 DUF4192 family protein [Rathayibacter sp. SD072]